jgi:hypothetical protein
MESNNNADLSGTNAVYNNVFYNLENTCSSGCGVAFWPSPPVGSTDNYFNNLIYNVGNMEVFNVGLNGGDQGPLVVFNNTVQLGNSGALFGNGINTHVHALTSANNHVITDSGSLYACPTCQVSDVTNLIMSNAAATSNGYTVSERYVYSPASSNSPTAGTGTNISAFCSTISTAAANDPTLSDAVTACLSDTAYACTYVSSNHTVNCPARAVISRPLSTAWDRGAYQSGTAQVNAPNPPSNLTAAVQ